jgi:large subunit ribosomal protein L9
MKHVKVILRQDVPTLGSEGDIVGVKAGYARNYLLPQGLAFEATSAALRQIEEDRRRAEVRAKREYLEARRRAAQLEGVSLTFHARAGDEGKLFGSITSADIVDRLNEQQGLDFQVDRRQVVLEEPIKALGVFAVPVRLHHEVEPEIKVWVIKGE